MPVTKLKSRCPLTEAEQATLRQAAYATWQYIGYDVLTALVEQGETDSIPRAEVIELVLDADYMKMHVKDGDLYRRFKTLDYDVQISVVRPAFPFPRYGM